MPRFTLYYDGKEAEAAAADCERVRQVAGIKVISAQPGLLLLSASRKTMERTMPQFQGWIASEEQTAIRPKPPRPVIKTTRNQ